MQQQILRSLIERDGGSDYRMNHKTYHFRPNAAGDHVCPVTDKADFQGFLAITEGFELYEGEDVPDEAGVTPDRGKKRPSSEPPPLESESTTEPNPAPEPEPEPEPEGTKEPALEKGGMDPAVKEQLGQMDGEALLQWTAENAPAAQVNRKMKPETMVDKIEEAMNGNG